MSGGFPKAKTWKQHFDEGMAFGQRSEFSKAEASFRDAVRLAPNEPYPHYELGYTLFLMGRYEEALEAFRRTDELACGFFLVQTEAYMCEQLLGGAIDGEVLSQLRLLQRLNDSGAAQSDQAAAAARRVVESAPGCALGHFYLGKALFEKEPAAAENALFRCVELGADDTTIINATFHLGVLRQRAGQVEEAHRLWREIVTAYPGNAHTKFAAAMSGPGSIMETKRNNKP